MSGGVNIVRVVEERGSRVLVARRGKKQARLPIDRVVFRAHRVADDDEAVDAFRDQTESIADGIDIVELWEAVSSEQDPVSLYDLAELYWGSYLSDEQLVALLICLDRDTLRFGDPETDGAAVAFAPRSPDAVAETIARRERQAQQAADADELAAALDAARLPPSLTPHQQTLLDGIRGYAISGDDYTRSGLVKPLLAKMTGGAERKSGDMQQFAFDILVAVGRMRPDDPIELEREGIPDAFSADALADADAIDIAPVIADERRLDLTEIPIVAIDDADTEDKDDALSLERLPDDDGWRLGVHISDAAALVPRGGALDEEASLRMATLYIPDRKTPMLPPALSQGKGSLEPGETRPALSMIARLTDGGMPLGVEVRPSVVRASAALSYAEADAAIADPAHEWHETLRSLRNLTDALKRRRETAGAVNIDKPELQIKIRRPNAAPDDDCANADYDYDDVEINVEALERDAPARQMVAECMVLCNALIAEFCRTNGLPAAYRSQPAPDLSDLGADLPPGVEIGGDGPLRWHLTMRRFAPSQTSTEPAPHGGLGVAAYTQVTSPLRRYPDLAMQRQISHFLRHGEPLYAEDEIASVGARADVQIRQLNKIEDERNRYWLLRFLQRRISDGGDAALFQAVVLENRPRRSAMLELVEYPQRVRARLPESVPPGATVTLRLHSVDLWRKQPQFTHEPQSS